MGRHGSHGSPDRWNGSSFVHKGPTIFDDGEPVEKLRVFDRRVELPHAVDGTIRYRDQGARTEPLPEVEPLRQECQHFIDCIRTGAQPRSDGHDGVRVVRVLAAAQQSLRDQGRPVAIAG